MTFNVVIVLKDVFSFQFWQCAGIWLSIKIERELIWFHWYLLLTLINVLFGFGSFPFYWMFSHFTLLNFNFSLSLFFIQQLMLFFLEINSGQVRYLLYYSAILFCIHFRKTHTLDWCCSEATLLNYPPLCSLVLTYELRICTMWTKLQ